MPTALERAGRDLNTLFARYPDIKFDATPGLLDEAHEKELLSSPRSNFTDHDESFLSVETASTANTTPLRAMPRPADPHAPDVPNLVDFLQHVESTDLPGACKDWFMGLAHQIDGIARLLVSSRSYLEGYVDSKREEILYRCQAVLARFQEANKRLEEQVRNISYIKSLAPFTVEPAQQDMWTIYRQRAKLIVNYTAPPSGTERKALSHLAHLFDANVYHSFLQLRGADRVDVVVDNSMNNLYDTVMSLLFSYGQWWEGMKSIRYNHMLPLMGRIRSSPRLLREIEEFEKANEAAKKVVSDPEAPGLQPADKNVIQKLNVTATSTRQAVLARTRNGHV